MQYAYDSLQRLQSAITVTDPLVTQWGQNFSYDGWGNLLGASVAKGSAPTFSVTVNGLTNRITGQSYDANGNQAVTGSSYDVENRLKGAGTYPNYYQYTYDGSNKRVAKSVPLTWDSENGTVSGEELLMFYGAGGERLAEFTMSIVKFGTPSQWYLRFTEKKTLVWFGSKLLRDGKYAVIQDRLGSVRWRRDTTNNQTETADYYPYGQEKPSATTNDREKFATYLRDPESGLDYADQRYHNPGWGRFLTADPYQASAGAGDPGSWNRYSYGQGDPVSHNDATGLRKAQIVGDIEERPIQLTGHYWNGEDFVSFPVFSTIQKIGRQIFQSTSSNTEVAETYMDNAVTRALDALRNNSKCRELFGTEESRKNGFDPATILETLFSNVSNDFAPEGRKIGDSFVNVRWQNDSLFQENTIGTVQGSLYVGNQGVAWGTSVTIAFGRFTSAAAANNDYAAAFVLHEMGHVYNRISGSGGSAVKDDGGPFGNIQSVANTQKVAEACGLKID